MTFTCGCAGTLFTERGTIATVFIICYALTSIVGGYVRYRAQSKWFACAILTAEYQAVLYMRLLPCKVIYVAGHVLCTCSFTTAQSIASSAALSAPRDALLSHWTYI